MNPFDRNRVMNIFFDAVSWLMTILLIAAVPLAIMWAVDVWEIASVTYDLRHYIATAILLFAVVFVLMPSD